MSLVLDLPAELESKLAAEASRLGVPLPEYVIRLLAEGHAPSVPPSTGAELLACWQVEGLVGTRPEIADGPGHARALREQAKEGAPLINGTGRYALRERKRSCRFTTGPE